MIIYTKCIFFYFSFLGSDGYLCQLNIEHADQNRLVDTVLISIKGISG